MYFAWTNAASTAETPRQLHQTLLDLVIAHTRTIAKHVTNLLVFDLPSEPSDHKLVLFDIRVQGYTHPSVVGQVAGQTSASIAATDYGAAHVATKFKYKKLQDGNVKQQLKKDLKSKIATWESALNMATCP
jgi:hypothetical protein